jgi:hypothetical protein
MTKSVAERRFICGSQYMSNNADYENVNYDTDDMVYYGANDNTYCNYDCFNCTVDCPYKKY